MPDGRGSEAGIGVYREAGEVIVRYGATAKNGTDALLWRTLSAVFQASISIDRNFLDIRTREL